MDPKNIKSSSLEHFLYLICKIGLSRCDYVNIFEMGRLSRTTCFSPKCHYMSLYRRDADDISTEEKDV